MGSPRILISGASGLIGKAVRRAAQARGAAVAVLVRRPSADPKTIYWDPTASDVPATLSAMEDFDAVVHLSGANIAHRWTQAYREQIVTSRVCTTEALCRALAALRLPPRVLLSASAVGIYGDRGDEVLTEHSSVGEGFLAETCIAWEAAAKAARTAGIRVAHLRFGVVLARDGGALAKMLPAFRLGLGGPMGSGQQWVSWVTLEDAVRAIFFLIEHEELAGAFNVTSPHPVTNQAFTAALAKALHRSAKLTVPAAMLRLIFGAMAQETLLASQRTLPQRLDQSGFAFTHAEIGTALEALLR